MASVEQILLYVPNLIGYARLLLIFLAWVFWDAHPPLFVILYVASAILDFFDGYFARKLNQCTSFGAWLDVVVDCIGRTMLWSNLYKFGFWICALEWTAFVCNHTLGSNWRQEIGDGASGSGRLSDKPSEIVDLGNTGSRSTGLIETTVQRIMAKGFHTPTGGLAIAGLHVLPIWLYGLQMNVFHLYISWFPRIFVYIGLVIFIIGRCLCGLAEGWCIWVHIKLLCQNNEHRN